MIKRIVTMCIGALIILTLAACDLSVRTENGTPTPVAANPQNLATTSDIDKLKQAIANTKEADSFHLETNVNIVDTIVRDVDRANNKSRYLRCNAWNGNSNCVQVITVITGTYSTKDNGATYTRGDKGDVGMDSLNYVWDQLTPEKIDRTNGMLRIGAPAAAETFTGTTTIHYTIIADDMAKIAPSLDIPQTNGTFDIWITDADEPVVLQMSFNGTAGFWPWEGRDLIATARWSKINEPVAIELPPVEKVKD